MGTRIWCPWCGSGELSVTKNGVVNMITCRNCSFEGPASTALIQNAVPRGLQESRRLKPTKKGSGSR